MPERTDQDVVVIESPDGRRAGVKLIDYRETPIDAEGHTYQTLHWRIVSWLDGTAYSPPPKPDDAQGAPASDAPSVPRRPRSAG